MLKFVLIEKENNEAELRMANVGCHCEMVFYGDDCTGGGYFKVDDNKKQVILYGKSIDYGYPKFEGKKITCEEFLFEDYKFYYVQDKCLPISENAKIDVSFE